ncbi:MAG: flagellar protein FlaG [Gallionella sp.]
MLIQNINNSAPVFPVAAGIPTDTHAVVTNTPTPVPSPQPTVGQLKIAVDSANHTMQQSHLNLAFSVDTATKTPVVTLSDSETGQVVLQFPSKEALAVAQSIDQAERRPGMLVNSKV